MQCTVQCNSAEKSAQLGAVQEVNRGKIQRGERSSGGVECLVLCSFVQFTGVLSMVGLYVGVKCTVGQCSVVQCRVMHRGECLQCIIVYFTVNHCTDQCYSERCTVHCTALQCYTLQCTSLLHTEVRCYTLQCMMQCYALLCTM